ncbi:hypothetical protein FEM48_Zijuj12G0152300 [Ziziphus jujuba var. spinosa]|uniref:non-specific serine/threonine protein kinase n=1 Tax=Ziziphus jujuba var. spinosa TaxID=714518 RepID=A0A978UE29_ZIZJJ|nr:hypothetical protein FEM48_Zijuj12G0152300 [Ziziphus jujuba var. spinosa]
MWKIAFIFHFGFLAFGFQAQLLPEDEVQKLEAISKALKMENIWSVSESSCNRSEAFNFTKRLGIDSIISNVTCDCSFRNGTVCHIKTINLDRNLLSGSIPASLSRAPLRILAISRNRLTGKIPKEIGGISILKELAFTQNQLEGPLPKELGNLKNLERLLLDQNQLEGSIPKELGNLTNLERLSVSENRLSGTIPKEIGDIHTLTELILDQNQLEGSLPEELGNLRNLETLTLSVNNFNGTIPQIFGNFKKLTDLILKNCSLSGSIPDYIGQNMSDLNTLDLSFNNLTGEIPETLKILGTGKQKHVDLSYNNFTERPPLIDCSFMNLNSVSSYSSFEKESWCLTKNLPCPITPNHKSLFINCGGDNLNHNGHEYEQDKRPEGISNFVSMNLKWGYSSTGGIVVLKDYNIVERSGGVGKSVTETFDATVSGSTLEIHLYWVGRGIAKFPHVGLYGPLISAITITKIESQELSVGTIIAIVSTSCAVIVILVLLVLWMTGYLGGNQHENHDVSGIPLQIGRFTLSQMRAATDNFNPVNKIGEGGFGPVYRGVLSDGSLIAVKQRSSRSQQGNREFISEVGIMSGLEHPNLVRLYGCCIEGDQLLLVYEYMENNSLARALFDIPVRNLKQEGNLMELVDSRLGSDYDQEEVMVAIHVALRCTHVSAANRPSMASVVSMLEGRVAAQELISGTASGVSMLEGMVAAQELITGPTVSNDDHEALRNTFQHMVEGNVSESEIKIDVKIVKLLLQILVGRYGKWLLLSNVGGYWKPSPIGKCGSYKIGHWTGALDGDVKVEIVEDTEPLRKELDHSRPQKMILNKPAERMAQHLKLLYINAHFDGMPVNRVLVDNGAAVNILSASMLAKLSKSEHDLISTELTVSNFQGGVTKAKGVLPMEITVGGKSIMTAFFVVEFKSSYNALLGHNWIHASLCVPSSLNQALWFWNGEEVEVVQADSQPFSVSINAVEAWYYEDEVGLVQFFDNDKQGHPTEVTAWKDIKRLHKVAKELGDELARPIVAQISEDESGVDDTSIFDEIQLAPVKMDNSKAKVQDPLIEVNLGTDEDPRPTFKIARLSFANQGKVSAI